MRGRDESKRKRERAAESTGRRRGSSRPRTRGGTRTVQAGRTISSHSGRALPASSPDDSVGSIGHDTENSDTETVKMHGALGSDVRPVVLVAGRPSIEVKQHDVEKG